MADNCGARHMPRPGHYRCGRAAPPRMQISCPEWRAALTPATYPAESKGAASAEWWRWVGGGTVAQRSPALPSARRATFQFRARVSNACASPPASAGERLSLGSHGGDTTWPVWAIEPLRAREQRVRVTPREREILNFERSSCAWERWMRSACADRARGTRSGRCQCWNEEAGEV